MANKANQDTAEALADLKRLRIRPNETVYTVLRHASSSGMYRVLDVFIMRKNAPVSITYDVTQALGYKWDRKHVGLGIGGCGMDMGFQVVYQLGSVLWPTGTSKPHSTRNGEPDTDGGYALKQRWL